MADGLLRGRERRYFGYLKDTTRKIETPESAKSYQSVVSAAKRETTRKYVPVKTFKPDPIGQARFADKIIHRAVMTQTPGLLPALKNSPQFDAVGETGIYLRSPDLEHHRGRSLHYFWLPKEDRTELCGIFQSHLKVKEKTRIRNVVSVKKNAGLTGIAAEVAAMEQQEYLESIAKDPRFMKTRPKRPSHVPSRILRMNRKFQASYWDPTAHKNLPDSFRRARNKTPAIDAICHEHFGQAPPEYTDLLTCVKEYNIKRQMNEELTADHLELEATKEQARRLTLFGSLINEEKRRGVRHIRQICEYDKDSNRLWKKQAKLIISAAEYINKIKAGQRFPTPPKDILKSKAKKKKSKFSAISSRDSGSEMSSIDMDDYANKQDASKDPLPKKSHKDGKNKVPSKRKKHKHYHHNYNSDEFYMEMYLHFLNPDEDVSLKKATAQLTDIQDIRRKMNLNENPEKDQQILKMLRDEMVEEVPEETTLEKEILEKYASRLNNQRMKQMLTTIDSTMSLAPDMVRLSTESLADSLKGTEVPSAKPSQVKQEDRYRAGDDDELDQMGDIPEHELKIIMSNIDVSDNGSDQSDNLSSDSSDNEEEQEETGKELDDEIKLFRTVKKKKDSVAEFMDLTIPFRERVCAAEEGKPANLMNPFAEAVCVLYPDGPIQKTKRDRMKNNATSAVTVKKKPI